jgi:tellurium resistance protein TerD
MPISLEKGQKISLEKSAPGIKKVTFGLGWDVLSGGDNDCDLDASVFLVDSNSKMTNDKDFIFYNNLSNANDSVKHNGDNLTGEGDGDDETVSVNLENIPLDIQKVIFITSIHEAESRSQNFGQVQNAYIRLINEDTNEEIAKFDLSEDNSIDHSVIMGELYRNNNEWKFNSLGTGTKDNISKYLENYSK